MRIALDILPMVLGVIVITVVAMVATMCRGGRPEVVWMMGKRIRSEP